VCSPAHRILLGPYARKSYTSNRVTQKLHDADLVFTAEGAIDFQTPLGKVPAEVAKRAKQFQLPVIALVGTVGKDAQINLEAGIDSFVCILETLCSLSDTIQNTPALLTMTAEQVMRLINIGRELKP